MDTIFWVFAMTRPSIEPSLPTAKRTLEPLRQSFEKVNTLMVKSLLKKEVIKKPKPIKYGSEN